MPTAMNSDFGVKKRARRMGQRRALDKMTKPMGPSARGAMPGPAEARRSMPAAGADLGGKSTMDIIRNQG